MTPLMMQRPSWRNSAFASSFSVLEEQQQLDDQADFFGFDAVRERHAGFADV